MALGDRKNANWHTINEEDRTYHFTNGESVTFEKVTSLHVSASGNHYLTLVNNKKAIVQSNWLYITFIGEWVA